MTTPAQQTQQDQQGVDLQDLLAAEAAFAAILTAAFLAWLAPGPPSIFGNSAAIRQRQLEDTLGLALRAFIERSARDLAAVSGRLNSSIAAAEVAAQVYPQILQNVVQWADESYRHIAQDLTSVADVGKLAQDSGDRIGRATAIYAQNDTRQQVANRLGSLWKTWVTRHDDKVRETHRELDEQEIPYDGYFQVPDGLLKYPGDPTGPLSETIMCRCHLRHRMAPEDRPYIV